jgi:Kef-type K+ transport system membrane component KefB
MREVGRVATTTGVLGVLLPLAGGIALGAARGYSTSRSIFVGVALVATSVGITSAVLIELGALGTRASRTILGAAVIDDVLAMLLLAVAVGLAAEGGVDLVKIAVVVALAVGFIVFFAIGGTRLTQRWPQVLTAPRFADSPLMPAVIGCLGLAALAASIGLAAIIGAFLAGMIVAETKEHSPIEDEVAPLYAFFPPFFFVVIGTEVSLDVLANAQTLGLLAAVTVIAVATKFAGAYVGALSLGRADAAIVGVGMIPRGEVGVIVAGIGRTEGVIGNQLFAAIVAMSVLTTLIAPPILRVLLARSREPVPEGA